MGASVPSARHLDALSFKSCMRHCEYGEKCDVSSPICRGPFNDHTSFGIRP
jgi:hypothetical protein